MISEKYTGFTCSTKSCPSFRIPAAAAFLTLAPTTVFTRYPTLLSASYSAFLLYQLILVLTAVFRSFTRQ